MNECTSTRLKTNKQAPPSGLPQRFHGCCISLFSFLVHIQQSTAAMLCTAAHVHPGRVREKGKRGRASEWEGGRRENLSFTVRDQRYIMGGRAILLLHAVFLTNHYMGKQYANILYKSEVACQALISFLWPWLPCGNRAPGKCVHCAHRQVKFMSFYVMGTCLPFPNFSNFLVN